MKALFCYEDSEVTGNDFIKSTVQNLEDKPVVAEWINYKDQGVRRPTEIVASDTFQRCQPSFEKIAHIVDLAPESFQPEPDITYGLQVIMKLALLWKLESIGFGDTMRGMVSLLANSKFVDFLLLINLTTKDGRFQGQIPKRVEDDLQPTALLMLYGEMLATFQPEQLTFWKKYLSAHNLEENLTISDMGRLVNAVRYFIGIVELEQRGRLEKHFGIKQEVMDGVVPWFLTNPKHLTLVMSVYPDKLSSDLLRKTWGLLGGQIMLRMLRTPLDAEMFLQERHSGAIIGVADRAAKRALVSELVGKYFEG